MKGRLKKKKKSKPAFAQNPLKVFVMNFADKWKIVDSVFPQAREIHLSQLFSEEKESSERFSSTLICT